MWSIGNEVPGRIEPKGIEAAERLRRTILNLDSSRPITAAICDWDYYAHNWEDYEPHAFQSLEAGGYNYLYDKYKKDHTSHPDRIIYGSESYANERSQNWDLVEECPYVIGDFVWTAIDYLGEAGIGSAEYRQSGNQPQFMGYPWFNGWCGDIDLLGEKKPQAYYRDVVWRNEPITMAVEKPVSTGTYQSISKWGWRQEYNSWTFNDCTPNDIMTVNVYSRSPLVRLYLNDQLIDTKATDSMYRTAFSVPYQPGILRSVEYDGTNEGNSFLLETSGFPEAIRLKSDKLHFSDDDQSLIYVTVELVDSQGRIVRDITDKIVFELNGKAQIIASGNGSPMDMESFRSESPSLYEGRAMVVLKGNRKSGKSVLKVKSENYGACSLVINDSEL